MREIRSRNALDDAALDQRQRASDRLGIKLARVGGGTLLMGDSGGKKHQFSRFVDEIFAPMTQPDPGAFELRRA